ncbi:MAG: class I SAM-dependent methyltransferase [Eubacterium sp.]
MQTNFSNLVRGVVVTLIESFRRITLLSQEMMKTVINSGDSVIDATVGTGEDTCFLARQVGKTGKVYGFDIQLQAIQATRLKLEEQKLLQQTDLFLTGHEKMDEIFDLKNDSKIKGIMFNLGYLPQGDDGIFTKVDTTLQALEKAIDLLAPKGLITLCLYRHPYGILESQAVERYCRKLTIGFNVHKIETINKNDPPYLIAVEKTK